MSGLREHVERAGPFGSFCSLESVDEKGTRRSICISATAILALMDERDRLGEIRDAAQAYLSEWDQARDDLAVAYLRHRLRDALRPTAVLEGDPS